MPCHFCCHICDICCFIVEQQISEDSFAVGVVLYALLISAWPQTKPEGESVTCLRQMNKPIQIQLRCLNYR